MHHPGSFTKNFGWKGNGLHKLRDAIRHGFGGRLATVERAAFRSNNKVADRDRWLIPANFFLHNHDGCIQPDELVRLALDDGHSRIWDQVALFALLLGHVGQVPRAPNDMPLGWANEYVREHVAPDGPWLDSALTKARIDAFLADHLQADLKTRTKCRTNWWHILALSGRVEVGLFNPAPAAEEWAPFALYLAFDRYLLDGRLFDRSLLDRVRQDELHKLAGVEEARFQRIAIEAYARYVEMGGLKRLGR